MKIIVIIGLYPPHHLGGYEIRCNQVVDHLVERGHEVEVITSICEDKNCELHAHDKNVYRKLHNIHDAKTKFQKAKTIVSDLRFIDKRIRRFKPDLIYLWHITSFTKNLMPYLAAINLPIVSDEGGRGLAFMWTNHGAWHNFLSRKSGSKFIRFLKNIIKVVMIKLSGDLLKAEWRWPENMLGYFNSEMGLRYARKSGVPTEEFGVIRSGIDIDLFSFKEFRDEIPQINFLMPGRIEPIKGQMDGVELFNHLVEKDIPAHLTIVGHVYSDEYFGEIIRFIEKNQLKSKITIHPMVSYDAMPDLYQQADISFFPSRQEMGFSRIPLEAMASGCLMITYGYEGSNEVVTIDENGYVVKPGDYEGISKIIQDAIENPHKTQQICKAARTLVEKKHSMEIYLNQIESFLEKSLHG